MRITTTMMTNNMMLSINKNRQTMATLEEQLSTGKQIQRPSDDPIVAARALKFRTTLSEIEQYETNSEDALSWLSVTEQAIDNSTDIMKRVRELAVQGSSGTLTTDNRESMIAEIEQLREQLVNEGNVSYAGRQVFTGFQTDKSLMYEEDESSKVWDITESFTDDNLEVVNRVFDNEIHEVNRIRLGYDDIDATSGIPAVAGYTVTAMTSDKDLTTAPVGEYPYDPPLNEIYFLTDTGELIFNQENVDATAAPVVAGDPELMPGTIDITYQKTNFYKGDLRPDHYFDSEYTDTNGDLHEYEPTEEAMNYQVSYSQTMQVNVMGYDVITVDLVRDLDELINEVKAIAQDDTLEDELQQDLLSGRFGELIGQMDEHLEQASDVTALIGGKVNRLELTISRLSEDNLNFTDLLSENEDVDMAAALIDFAAQEVVYNAALQSSAKIIQPTLLDFIG